MTWIEELSQHADKEVEVRGWLANKRSSGKIGFLQVRDGTGQVQAVVSKAEVADESWEAVQSVTQESTVRVRGRVNQDDRAPGGYELHATEVEVLHPSAEFPISPKHHGVAFLMQHRHLWLRSAKQRACLRVRSEVCQAIRDYFYTNGFTLIDSPILTPAACEGTSTLFETDYFDDKAYLSQSGQLYLEPAAAALGKVYCFGPTFRAERSKTRRHLMEFWMVEPEVAFLDFEGACELAEDFLCSLVARVLERCAEELKVLERDTAKLEAVSKPFPHITYTAAVEKLRSMCPEFEWGEDFGATDETDLVSAFDRPLIVSRFPKKIKAFYMEPDPEDADLVLGFDVLAPEGYGEIIGGSQRMHDLEMLERAIREHDLPREAFEWYLDVRRYGTFPHSGFGMGVERFVAWMCGVTHLRETIPYPRMLDKIYP